MGCCEHGNGHSVSVKFGGCLVTENVLSLQKLLLFADLVHYWVMVLFS